MKKISNLHMKPITLLICAIALIILAPTTEAKVIFDGNFTSGWESRAGAVSDFTFSCIVSADRFVAMPSYMGRKYVGKFIIKPGDKCNVRNNDERNQVAKMWTSSVIGTTQWYGFSFMLDPTWTQNGYIKPDGTPSNWFMLWEFGWPTEVLDISMDNKLIAYKEQTISTLVHTEPLLNKGEWYDVLAQIKLSYETNGLYEVWFRRPGETTYSKIHYSTGVTAYPTELAHQLGPYRGPSANTQIVYVSDYKVGTTRADVSYSGSTVITPTPTPTPTPVVTMPKPISTPTPIPSPIPTIGLYPVCSFTTTSNSNVITFKDTSTNSPTRYDWIYGDGNTLYYTTSKIINHTYLNSGTYTTKHLASNQYGVSGTCLKTITINVPVVTTPAHTIPIPTSIPTLPTPTATSTYPEPEETVPELTPAPTQTITSPFKPINIDYSIIMSIGIWAKQIFGWWFW